MPNSGNSGIPYNPEMFNKAERELNNMVRNKMN